MKPFLYEAYSLDLNLNLNLNLSIELNLNLILNRNASTEPVYLNLSRPGGQMSVTWPLIKCKRKFMYNHSQVLRFKPHQVGHNTSPGFYLATTHLQVSDGKSNCSMCNCQS
jgi:hypothetical protein